MAVYFISDNCGYVKIGHGRDPYARLSALQCGTVEPLSLIRIVEGGEKAERWFHKKFADRHVRGEWFHFCQEMLDTPAPDEIPESKRKSIHKPFGSLAEYLREADRLGCLGQQGQEFFGITREAAE